VLGSSPFADPLIATISERFARFVCRLGGHAKIGLILRHWKGYLDGSSSAALDRHRFDAGKPVDNTNSQRRAASDLVHDTVIAFDSGCSAKYTDIPIDLMEEALGMEPGRDHLFEVFIQIHAKNKLNGAINGPGGSQIRFRQIDPDKHESLLGLQFEVMKEEIDKERSIRVLMSYRSDHYTPQQVERLRKTTSDVFASFSKPGVLIRPISNPS